MNIEHLSAYGRCSLASLPASALLCPHIFMDPLSNVLPDIVVISDQNKLDKRGCLGAPDITVEILSPSTSYKDQTEKLLLYEKHDVKEYWIVNPDAKYVMIYRLEGVKYGKPEYLTENDILESRSLEGLKIDLSEVWASPCSLWFGVNPIDYRPLQNALFDQNVIWPMPSVPPCL